MKTMQLLNLNHKRLARYVLLIGGCWLGGTHTLWAQRNQRLVGVGLMPGLGIGSYNALGANAGLSVRYQHPLRGQMVLTTKTGLDFFAIRGRYADAYRQQYQTATGLSIPLTIGPRYYYFETL